MSLRKHMETRHPRVKRPRSNADLAKVHANEHYRFAPNHDHAGGKGAGAHARPAGWTTGDEVIEKRRK